MRGKVRAIIIIWVCMRDHPRACGEKYTKNDPYTLPLGSPPRMRGKVSAVSLLPFFTGITPAHAGKSQRIQPAYSLHRDHPRACGEKLSGFGRVCRGLGSPPRMRGKGRRGRGGAGDGGITPAHAGKSQFALNRPLFRWDHPRACGEKKAISQVISRTLGSPPRMRGKGSKRLLLCLWSGITPAHAGKRSVGPMQASV